MATAKTLRDLFHATLKDIYFAEKKILTALPKMAKAAQSPKLKAAFQKHQSETEGQVARLEEVFAEIGQTPRAKTCDAILGILEEGKEIMKEYKNMPALDAGLGPEREQEQMSESENLAIVSPTSETPRPRTNEDWWPERLDLSPLRANSALGRTGLSIALILGLSAVQGTQTAIAGHSCECVEYVKSMFGMRGAAGNAKDMGPFLAAHGFRRSTVPVPGAVVIIQPRFYPAGDGAIYGHVAIVTGVAPSGKSSWVITVRGANQTGSKFSAAGCSNVSAKSFGPYLRTTPLFSYWLPPRASGR